MRTRSLAAVACGLLLPLLVGSCAEHPSRDECARLWRHMEELMGSGMDPVARARFAERMKSESVAEVERCTREVSREQLRCALAAKSEPAIAECEKL